MTMEAPAPGATWTGRSRGGKGWIAFAVINSLVTFFGLSYIFFPMGTVEADGNKTTGVLDVPREIWGTFLVVCAVALLIIAVTGLRRGRHWAWRALWSQLAFFVIVAAVEPDPVFPTLFGLILATVLVRSRHRFL